MHRDLKPENVLFNRTILNLKVIDFGLATKPPASNKCGTPGYVAPEVLMQNSYGITYDEKVDIFSIGVIFYKMYYN
jgi:serine/threonine protein kinase